MSRFFNVGNQSFANADKVKYIISADAEKARRTLQKYNADRNSDKVSDMTFSKGTRSMLIMDDGSIGLSSVNATVLVKRANGEVD